MKMILIVFSGSGNSVNVTKALEEGNRINMVTFAILGFHGGKCKSLAKIQFILKLMICKFRKIYS